MFYTATIAAANVIIILVNTLLAGDFWLTALFSVLGTVSVIAYDGITAFLIRRLPEKWFAPEKKVFGVSRFEKRVYSKLKVKRLASFVPELGGFTNFHKDKLETWKAFLRRIHTVTEFRKDGTIREVPHETI